MIIQHSLKVLIATTVRLGVLAKRKGTRRIIKNLARCCVRHGHTGTLLKKESMQHKKVAILL